MARRSTENPCQGASAKGVPCTQWATRQLPVSILAINGRPCGNRDQLNAPWVCAQCHRFSTRCAQQDAQPHDKCIGGPTARCTRRLAAFRLNEFAFNFTSTCDNRKHETAECVTGHKRRRRPRGSSTVKASRARRPRRGTTAARSRVPATSEPCASMDSVHYDRSCGAGAAAAGASNETGAVALDSLLDTSASLHPAVHRVQPGSTYSATRSGGMPSPAKGAQAEKRLLALFADLDPTEDFEAGGDFDGCCACDASRFPSSLGDDCVGGKDVDDLRFLSSTPLEFGVSGRAAYEDELKQGTPLL